jgi:hypothetical protein
MIRSGPVRARSAIVMAAILGSAMSQAVVHGQEEMPRRQRHESVAIDTLHQNPEPTRQIREGSTLKNELGTFQIVGDRVVFSPADGRISFPVLENMALERVWRMLEEVGGRQWCVSGMVTEYRGRNFLLLERAVVRVGTEDPAANPKAVEPRG